MKLAIFTLVEHVERQGKYYGYAPYVREMDLWNLHFDDVVVVAPISQSKSLDEITIPYAHTNIKFVQVPVFHIKTFIGIFRLLIKLPNIIFKMIKVMRNADHLHFRSPSNIVAIAAILQIFFPSKKKTMRYTGNWDPNSKQPIGYRFQKAIFSNSFLTRNMTGLVYGDWSKQSNNINSFFTATFHENEKEKFVERNYSSYLKFVYTGALVEGKRPLLALQIIERLKKKGIKCKLDIYGNGPLMSKLKDYIENDNLKDSIVLHGNENKEIIKQALKQSHFTILPSKSEGWPKAIAEGMFFGSIPISTKISCLEWMLDYGKRGILIEPDLDTATEEISNVIKSRDLIEMSRKAQSWSQKYTVEKQAAEIKKIVMT